MKLWIYLTAILTVAVTVSARAAEPTNAGSAHGPAFDVRQYQVEGNTVLPQKMMDDVLNKYTGSSVEVERVRQGLGELQLLYRNLGFATVSVTLPQQRLSNGIVRVQVVEGKLSDIIVTGNRYYSSLNVWRALPSLGLDEILNTRWLQPELDRANVNPDRQIYPVISPGLQPGTTCLTLQVKDRLPLHWRSDVNDKATPGTPLLRMDNAIEYNNLWQYNHQIGLDYNFSPTAMKAENYLPRFYDQPAVASYSAFYRAPFGPGQGLRELYEEMPVNFGYDEVSHQFNLPPPTGSPELMLYASRSSTEIPTRYGPLKIVNQTDILEVSEQTAERDLTMNENLGLKLTVPLEEFAGIHSSVNAGFNFKSFEQRNFATNLAHVSLYSTNTGTPVLVSSATDALAANSGQSVQYVPLSLGWTAARTDRYGNTSVNLSDHLYLSGLASARKNFQAVAEAKEAGGTYTTFRGSVTRVENLPRQWSLMFRGGGQWASEPLIANEEFPLGGISGVRGYREGETYGDTGWHGQLDARAPPINIGYFPYQHTQVPAEVRAAWFMDVGQAWVKESSFSAFNEWGTGPTVYLTASRRFEARLTLGWALRDGVLTHAGGLNGYFNVGVQF